MKLSLAKVVVVQLALVTITTCALAPPPPTFRTKPLRTAQHTATEWAEILKRVQPSINNSYAGTNVQHTTDGKVVNDINPSTICGAVAVVGQFPWQGRFFTDNYYPCGCSLIREDLCLTAAHCIGANRVYFGSDVPSAGNVVVNVAQAITHAAYDADNITNDIAILKLASNVVLTANIGLVKLPPLSDVSINFNGTSATISGFGGILFDDYAIEALLFVQMTVVPNEVCAAIYNLTRESHICTRTTGKKRCWGIGGDPLVYKDSSNAYVLIGMLTFMGPRSDVFDPSVFVSTTAHLDWIYKTIALINATNTTVPATTTTTTTSTTARVTTTKATTSKTTTKATTSKTTTKATTSKTTTKTKTTTTKKPTTTKPTNCAGGNFLTMAKCCNIPPNPIVIYVKGDKTCMIGPSKIKIFNTYYLNKLQNIKKNNTIDVKDEKAMKTVAKDACFVSCILKDAGAMNDDETFNLDDFKDFVALNQEEWKESIPAIVDACMAEVKNYAPPSVTADSETCPTTGAAMIQCIQFAFIKACPSPSLSSSCTKNKKTFDKCGETIMQGMYSMSAIKVVKKLPQSNKLGAVGNQKVLVKSSKTLVAKTAVN